MPNTASAAAIFVSGDAIHILKLVIQIMEWWDFF
jgi:hypothetical protein